ncbi:hypothetical protein PR048_010068 [Dryococelus australis]|uniref:Uncharacterized protein n=1 Tax=Dryococelus australis TaxID=614101 RepID=A0ABQ9I2N3_9NEOP|nr:hypothetical protein PR048_010068 [Dryococelus australis]
MLWHLETKQHSRRQKAKTFTAAIHGSRGLPYTPADKMEVIADTLETQFEPYYNRLDEEQLTNSKEATKEEAAKQHKYHHKKFTLQETMTAICTLPNNKATGPDGIPNEALKNLLLQAIIYIKYMYKIMDAS